MNNEDRTKLIALRDMWERMADDTERLYGKENPASKALTLCIADLDYEIQTSSKKPDFKI